jgi:hypothetical protein
MYESYRASHNDEEAKRLVAESIKEQLGLFMGSDSVSSGAKEVIDKKIKELQAELTEITQGYDNYDMQMYVSEQISTLQEAKKILGI